MVGTASATTSLTLRVRSTVLRLSGQYTSASASSENAHSVAVSHSSSGPWTRCVIGAPQQSQLRATRATTPPRTKKPLPAGVTSMSTVTASASASACASAASACAWC
jgi:hypothetical protein